LDVNAATVGASAWSLLEIMSGQPCITTETYQEFVPQMVNLDVIDGVSFTKGCYPGQEIVARVRYLGKIKRKMFLAYAENSKLPQPNAPLYRGDDKSATTGNVVAAAPGPDGGCYLLCVLELSHVESGIYLDSECSQPIKLMDLPYPVEI
jgi:hypothetical protein